MKLRIKHLMKLAIVSAVCMLLSGCAGNDCKSKIEDDFEDIHQGFSATEIRPLADKTNSRIFVSNGNLYFTEQKRWENPELINNKTLLSYIDQSGDIINCTNFPNNYIVLSACDGDNGFFADIIEFSPEKEYENQEYLCRFSENGDLEKKYTFDELNLSASGINSMVFVGSIGYFQQFDGTVCILDFADNPELKYKAEKADVLQLAKNPFGEVFALTDSGNGIYISSINKAGIIEGSNNISIIPE